MAILPGRARVFRESRKSPEGQVWRRSHLGSAGGIVVPDFINGGECSTRKLLLASGLGRNPLQSEEL